MDAQNENLVIMKWHNRKIVERAYQNSIANAKYTFPKSKILPETYTNLSSSISLCSRVSEVYDLHSQNTLPINLCHNMESKIAPLSSILKLEKNEKEKDRNAQKYKGLILSRKGQEGINQRKRQFLSLTPKKQLGSRSKYSSSVDRTTGINVTRIKSGINTKQKYTQKNGYRQEQSLMKSLQRMTSRCLGMNEQQQISKDTMSQAIFNNSQKRVIYSNNNKRGQQSNSIDRKRQQKIRVSSKLSKLTAADSTPLLGQQKTKSIEKKRGEGMREMAKLLVEEGVYVSAFVV